MKNILVIGAGGFIGSAITRRLLKEENRMSLIYGTSSSGRSGMLALDVTEKESVVALDEWLVQNEISLHAIVYAAGDCKRGGFMEELKIPLKDMDPSKFMRKAGTFGLGFANVITVLLPRLADNGHIVVMSSVTGTEKPPLYLSGGLYASPKSAQELLVKWAREDTLTIQRRGIRVHRIAPGAVKGSPFYEGVEKELLPARMVPVEEVAEAIAQAINMPTGCMDTNFFADAVNE